MRYSSLDLGLCDNVNLVRLPVAENDPNYVLSLARGLQVIEAFHGHRGGLTVSDAAGKTGLSRAAVRRLFLTLESLGYAERIGTAFRLTSKVMRLGSSFVTSQALPTLAIPVLEQLSGRIHESCSVSVPDGVEIVHVARAAGKRVMAIDLSVGSRLPAYCTSMGRVLLAALPEAELEGYLGTVELKAITAKTVTARGRLEDVLRRVRTDGYALVDQELELGLRSIAVPVTSRSGKVVAAMNSGVSAARVNKEEMKERILPALVEHAEMLGGSLS